MSVLKMWWSVIFLSTSSGLEVDSINISVNYFQESNVKWVCFLSCERDLNWSYQFTKLFSEKQLFVSTVKTNSFIDYNKVEKCLQQRFTSIGVLIDAKCEYFEEVLTFASQNTWLDSRHKWLILNVDNTTIELRREDIEQNSSNDNNTIRFDEFEEIDNNKTISGILCKLNISVDADIMIAIKESQSNFNLYEAFNFGKVQGGNLIINQLCSWNYSSGFDYNLNEYKYYRRWDFRQWAFRMPVVMTPAPKKFDPDMILGRKNSEVITISQAGIRILHVIADMHNFRYNYTVADRWIGRYSRNESKVVATSMYYREQDISPVIRIQPGSLDYFDVGILPVNSIETRYYYRIPTHGLGKLENQFLRPLTSGAWNCVLAIAVLCALGLLMAATLEQRPSSAQYAVFSVFASFCQQFFIDFNDNAATKESSARKSTVFVTGLSCVLIYNYYTSSVVSWLLSGPPPSINSLQELLESPLELIFEDIGYTRSWLQNPAYFYNKRNADVENALRREKVFKKKKDAPIFKGIEDGIEMVKDGGYAYHTEVSSANRVISRKFTKSELCDLGSLTSMEKALLYPIMQKNSPYREFFNWSFLQLYERGIVTCIQRWSNAPLIMCELSSPRPLTLGGAAPAFLILLFGYLLAIVILIVERLMVKMKKTDESHFMYLPIYVQIELSRAQR